MTPTGAPAITLAAAGTTNTELVTQGATTLRNGLPGVQALTTGSTTSYLQRDPKGGLLSISTGIGTTGEYYYVLDGQSSVIGLVDAAGTERAKYTYDPYGAHDTATALGVGGLPDNPYRYASGRAVATNTNGNITLYQYGERFPRQPLLLRRRGPLQQRRPQRTGRMVMHRRSSEYRRRHHHVLGRPRDDAHRLARHRIQHCGHRSRNEYD